MPCAEVQLPTQSGVMNVEVCFDGDGPSIRMRVKDGDVAGQFVQVPLKPYSIQESIFMDGCRYWKRWTNITDTALSGISVAASALIAILCVLLYTHFFS